MPLKLVTPPVAEPIDVEEAKTHLRILESFVDENEYIEGLISVARETAERKTWRALMPQSWEYYLDDFPPANASGDQTIRIPLPPLTAISAITYVDPSGTPQTFSAASYKVDLVSEPGRVRPANGVSWPATSGDMNNVKISFTCGYADAAHVPVGILHAMKIFIGHIFENRELLMDGKDVKVPMAIDVLLEQNSVKELL